MKRHVPILNADARADFAPIGVVIGYLIVALFPSLFWTGVMSGAVSLFDLEYETEDIGGAATAIAAFLFLVFHALRTQGQNLGDVLPAPDANS